jgi:hypothetical protein
VKRPKSCVTRLRHHLIVLGGVKTSTLYLDNPHGRTVDRKELDGCLHPEGAVCDWLVETADAKVPKHQLLVELKGHRWATAAAQLENALAVYPPNRGGFRTRFYIVGTGFPSFRAGGPKLIEHFYRRYSVELRTAKSKQHVPLEA